MSGLQTHYALHMMYIIQMFKNISYKINIFMLLTYVEIQQD